MTISTRFSQTGKKLSVSLFAIIAALTIQAQTGGQNIRLNKGQKLESQTTSTSNMSQNMMGQQVEFNSKSTITMLTEVKDVTNQAFQLSNTLKRMVMNTSVMGQEINFDSDKKEDMEGEVGMALKDKIGVSQDISVDKQGKITSTSNDTASTSKSQGGMMGMMGDAVQGAMVKGAPYPLFVAFPSKTPKQGDSWTDSSGTPETMKMVNTYTVKQVSGSEATLEISGLMAKTGTVEQQGMQMQMNLAGVTKGTSIVDLSTGVLKKNDTSMKITGTMEIMGQSIPLSMDNTIQTTVTKQQ
ncbi:MAG: hypothetical protein INR73_23970 [Williamsia sp.]|nr:hypothetical protein [Williamsia sp.]